MLFRITDMYALAFRSLTSSLRTVLCSVCCVQTPDTTSKKPKRFRAKVPLRPFATFAVKDGSCLASPPIKIAPVFYFRVSNFNASAGDNTDTPCGQAGVRIAVRDDSGKWRALPVIKQVPVVAATSRNGRSLASGSVTCKGSATCVSAVSARNRNTPSTASDARANFGRRRTRPYSHKIRASTTGTTIPSIASKSRRAQTPSDVKSADTSTWVSNTTRKLTFAPGVRREFRRQFRYCSNGWFQPRRR